MLDLSDVIEIARNNELGKFREIFYKLICGETIPSYIDDADLLMICCTALANDQSDLPANVSYGLSKSLPPSACDYAEGRLHTSDAVMIVCKNIEYFGRNKKIAHHMRLNQPGSVT